ncbi:hypothetical protein MBLNU459_g3614t1 [Dothideomycetes sp. NU459]
MSWSSRFGAWSGRFSPFGRSSNSESTQVNDSDYSYITSDDLRKAQERSPSPVESGPPRDTDVLILKSKRVSYPVHFPAYSITKGELSVGAVREQAAKKTATSDPRRIKLFYKGKNLKEDGKSCRAEGLREGGEIMCVIGDAMPESLSSSDSEDDGVALDQDGEAPKRKRIRNKNRKKKGKKPSGTSTPSDSLPVPQSGDSRAASPKPPPTPLTPMDKLNAVNHTLQGLLPQCINFTTNPPSELAKKEFEHKRLGETILAQVLIKLDAVETEGDTEARARRKEIVKEAQRVLSGLDDAMK